MDVNFDQGVRRAWARIGKAVGYNPMRFHWGMLPEGDHLLQRQIYMVREGRHSLHNMIRGAHGLPNRY